MLLHEHVEENVGVYSSVASSVAVAVLVSCMRVVQVFHLHALVVLGLLLRIGQHLVGLPYALRMTWHNTSASEQAGQGAGEGKSYLEHGLRLALLGLGLGALLVRVPPERGLAVRRLDLRVTGRLRHAQDRVQVLSLGPLVRHLGLQRGLSA